MQIVNVTEHMRAMEQHDGNIQPASLVGLQTGQQVQIQKAHVGQNLFHKIKEIFHVTNTCRILP